MHKAIKILAAQHGLRFDAMNSNTFQDQKNQKHSYKFGSLQHVNKSVRDQAIDHNLEVIEYGKQLGLKFNNGVAGRRIMLSGTIEFQKGFSKYIGWTSKNIRRLA